jgi:hypothetical protein
VITSPGKKVVISRNGTNAQLQRAIEAAVPLATQQTKQIAKQFKGRNEKETAAKVFNYLKNQVNYKADRNEQNVQLPSAIMRDKSADCKSYSLFTMGVLNNLGIPAKLRYASYANDPTPTHVYVVTNKGTIIDAVYGKFNAEKPYKFKKDKSISGMNINYISGIRGPQKNIGSVDWAKRVGYWNKISMGEKAAIRAAAAVPIVAGGRKIILAMMKKNAAGLATSLYKARTANPKGYRDLEIKWLKKGGDVDKLNRAIKEGSTKTATGKYFHKLVMKKASGQSIRPDQWIAGLVSALFGKKYQKGQDSTITIAGDPVSVTMAGVTFSAPVWVAVLLSMISLALPFLLGSVASSGPGDVDPMTDETTPETETPRGGALAGAMPIIAIGLIGGLVYMAAKKGIKGKK